MYLRGPEILGTREHYIVVLRAGAYRVLIPWLFLIKSWLDALYCGFKQRASVCAQCTPREIYASTNPSGSCERDRYKSVLTSCHLRLFVWYLIRRCECCVFTGVLVQFLFSEIFFWILCIFSTILFPMNYLVQQYRDFRMNYLPKEKKKDRRGSRSWPPSRTQFIVMWNDARGKTVCLTASSISFFSRNYSSDPR